MNKKFEKGTYILGDLCYVMTDTQWKEVCNELDTHDPRAKLGDVKTLIDGTIYGILGTQHGDGVFGSNVDERFPVDSGTIGCMKVSAEKVDGILHDTNINMHLVAKVTFKNDFYISKHEDGKLHFDDIIIDTDPCNVDEEDDVSQDEF